MHHDAACEVTEDVEHEIDAPTSTLLANLNKMNAASYFPSEDCRSLSPEAKESWGKMQNDMKAIVLKGRNNDVKHNDDYDKSSFNSNEPKSNQFKTVKPPTHNNNSFTKANLHQLSSELFVEEEELEVTILMLKIQITLKNRMC